MGFTYKMSTSCVTKKFQNIKLRILTFVRQLNKLDVDIYKTLPIFLKKKTMHVDIHNPNFQSGCRHPFLVDFKKIAVSFI